MEKKNKAIKKNKRNKTSIVFNEASRKEFLTGFRKRKNERRKRANDQLEKEYKNEVRKAKIKAREDVISAKTSGASSQIVPEIEHLLKGRSVSQSTIEDYGSHTVSVTHLNGFGKCEPNTELESNSDIENETDINQQKKPNTQELPTNAGLRKNDLKNVNKQVAKTVGKSKAFAHLKKQSNNDKKSTGGKKVNKLQKKFSKKSMESKRAKHYNPKNTSHKKNKT